MSGQSIVDRLNAAKHTVAGSALGRAVVKATTDEIMGPKRKHLDYLLQCTSEINVSIPQMADLLIERTQNPSWAGTFKALITIHHLMCYGNERFSQYMASHNSKFIINTYLNRNGPQGIDMSTYIRKYAHYLNEKRETYKLMGYDFCKVKRGKDDGMLRTMNTEKLLKTLPILQKQLDALVQFDVQPNELTNGVINSCFVLLSKDLIRLFACYNDGVINLLEKFFDMNKKNCKEALDIYKKFLDRTDTVSSFLKVAESSGIDKSDIPDLTKAPSSLLDALEAHVNGADGSRKATLPNSFSSSNVNNNGGGGGVAAASSSNKQQSQAVTSAINSLNSNTSLSAEEKRRVLEEEAKTLEQFKSNHLKKQTPVTSPTKEDPFNQQQQSQTMQTSQSQDLFGFDLTNGNSKPTNFNPQPTTNNNTNTNSASDDLLMLSGPNPFIQNIVNQSYGQTAAPNPFQQNSGAFSGAGAFQQQQPTSNNFQMNSMFNIQNQNQNKIQFDAFGDVLQPTSTVLNPMGNRPINGNDQGGNKTPTGLDQKILSTNLDASLASLANNLDINYKNNNFQKNHQWNGSNVQQSQNKTGGQQWQPTVPVGTFPGTANQWNNTPLNPTAMNPAWVNPNPFAASMQPMPMQPNLLQQQPIRPAAVPSSNNPFDLF
jgi:hypothetical protein